MFASAITNFATYERCAVPGLDLVKESDSVVLAHRSIGSVFRNYNFILGEARKRDDLEALVLIHQDAELVDPDFCQIDPGAAARSRGGPGRLCRAPSACGASPGGRAV